MRRHCYNEARRLGRSHTEAEDIAQEALLRAWRKRGSCRNPDRPFAWVQEITRNESHRLFSRRAMTHELPTDRLPEPPAQSGEDAVLTRIDVERALGDLSPTDRLMVRLRYEADHLGPTAERSAAAVRWARPMRGSSRRSATRCGGRCWRR
jgi:RNA polymerase sigma-70 factor (ECF subfamily)